MANTAKNRGKMTRGFEEQYRSLCHRFPPRAITSKRQMVQTQAVIDSLIDKPGKLSKAERDYLNTLGALVYDYEERNVEVPAIYGVKLIRQLMQDRALRQKDLVPIFRTESIVSAVLNGRRQLTRRHIEESARFFAIPASAFLPDTTATVARVA
jgi:HTH-type transcriptional regulator/antitoxin HigA